MSPFRSGTPRPDVPDDVSDVRAAMQRLRDAELELAADLQRELLQSRFASDVPDRR